MEMPNIFRSNIQNFLINSLLLRYQLSYQLEIEKLQDCQSPRQPHPIYLLRHLRIDITNLNRIHIIMYENTCLHINSDLSQHP